jgi:hypothetical protein
VTPAQRRTWNRSPAFALQLCQPLAPGIFLPRLRRRRQGTFLFGAASVARFLRCFARIHGARSYRASLDHFGARNETPASFWERDPSERSVAETLIADINRIVHILDGDIAAEEKRAREIDRPQVEYPMLARTIASRRDNLLNTIGALEERLGKLNQAEQELA